MRGALPSLPCPAEALPPLFERPPWSHPGCPPAAASLSGLPVRSTGSLSPQSGLAFLTCSFLTVFSFENVVYGKCVCARSELVKVPNRQAQRPLDKPCPEPRAVCSWRQTRSSAWFCWAGNPTLFLFSGIVTKIEHLFLLPVCRRFSCSTSLFFLL